MTPILQQALLRHLQEEGVIDRWAGVKAGPGVKVCFTPSYMGEGISEGVIVRGPTEFNLVEIIPCGSIVPIKRSLRSCWPMEEECQEKKE
jgi:hypothetical protein